MNKNLKEDVRHGTLQFPFALYTHNRNGEELLVPHHWHKEIEIIDIALECGYDNIGYFIRKFKEYKGYKPSDYIRQNIK